jgi:hypothetical protein
VLAQDRKGRRALDVATQQGHHATAEFLRVSELAKGGGTVRGEHRGYGEDLMMSSMTWRGVIVTWHDASVTCRVVVVSDVWLLLLLSGRGAAAAP